MRQRMIVSAVAVLTAVAAFPQTDDWRLRMKEAAAAESAGDYAKAVPLYREAAALAEAMDRTDSRRSEAWNLLGTAYSWIGRFVDAEASYRRALAEVEQSSGKSGATYAFILANLGSLYVETGQSARGEKLLRESLAIQLAVEQPDQLRVAVTQNLLAEILLATGRHAEADRLLTSSVAALDKRPGDQVEAALARNNLGVVRYFQKRYPESERFLLQSLATLEQIVGPGHPLLVRVLNNLAALEGRTGHLPEAGQRLSRALEITERRLGTEHPLYGSILANYAVYLRQAGEKSRAKTLQARAKQILKDSFRRNGIGAVVDISSLQPRK